ncbi:hypothetical protein F2Q69_00033988 [Brassica cretica]|uniref:Uncharacterized protein n=1 Tax=Brassica cretica TaxID=69181 RepID=A0A8S9SSR0_BRACR|nr:hypothetical protein F2Q69_00033988 [Brassica cretica]
MEHMSQYYWEDSRCRDFDRVSFFSFGSYSLLAKGEGDLKGDYFLLVALVDETATALAVGLGDEGKWRPFYRWLSSTKENADLSVYQWLSETGGLIKRHEPFFRWIDQEKDRDGDEKNGVKEIRERLKSFRVMNITFLLQPFERRRENV